MRKIIAIIQAFMLQKVCEALRDMEDLPSMTVSEVLGWGKGRAVDAHETVHKDGCAFVKERKIELVVPSAMTDRVVGALGIACFLLMPFAEEPWLRERFGAAYDDYVARVLRFIGWRKASRKVTG